jgi:LacI family transcriptional regulator
MNNVLTLTTLDQVAKRVGVSKATVSRVINQSPRVAPELMRSVREAMERIGYQPPRHRRGPKPKTRTGARTGNLLLLALGFPDSDPYGTQGYPFLLRGVETAVHENGLKLVLASLNRDGTLPVALDPDEVDGVLLFGKAEALSASARARVREMPAVCLMRGFDEFRGQLDRVVFDNSAVGPMAARYLAERGHQRVGFYSINPTHPAMIPRQQDFTAIAAAAGLEVIPYVSEHPFENLPQEIAGHHQLAQRLATESRRITGLFIPADYWAPYVYQALSACGIVPGRDLDIISCDNVPLFLDPLSPRPATIDINLPLVGAMAVRHLLWRIANAGMKNPVELSVEPVLVPGTCSGPWLNPQPINQSGGRDRVGTPDISLRGGVS